MSKYLTIEDVMTPDPYTLDVNESILVARMYMKRYDVRHLVVTEENKVIGILSDRDIQFALGWNTQERSLSVKNIVTRDPYKVDVSTPLQVVVENMWEDRIGSALVEKNENLVGIFTSMDACRELGLALRSSNLPAELAYCI